jgi:hypothetical protein
MGILAAGTIVRKVLVAAADDLLGTHKVLTPLTGAGTVGHYRRQSWVVYLAFQCILLLEI